MPKMKGQLTKYHNQCYIGFSPKVYENIFRSVSQIINVIRCGNTFYIEQ